jgi:hypothetical protein
MSVNASEYTLIVRHEADNRRLMSGHRGPLRREYLFVYTRSENSVQSTVNLVRRTDIPG